MSNREIESANAPASRSQPSDRRTLVIGSVLVGLSVTALALPGALLVRALSPDAIEHVGIASNWVQGRGFVDPVTYSYFLDAPTPFPGIAMRAPAISVETT